MILEKRLLWHPRYDSKFIVGGGSQIVLYEWATEYPRIRHTTSQQDLYQMKVLNDAFVEISFTLLRYRILTLPFTSVLRGPQIPLLMIS